MCRRKSIIALAALLCLCLAAFAAPAFAGKKKREKHVDKWPQTDLSAYSVLYIETFEMTDPKAAERKKVVQVKSAPKRLSDYVEEVLEPGVFDEVHRGPLEQPAPGTVVLAGEITQYKPGSRFGRAMLAGAGSAHMDFVVHLVDGQDGTELTSFSAERTWAWGGIYGATKGVEDIEQNVAYELALYLQRCKSGEDSE